MRHDRSAHVLILMSLAGLAPAGPAAVAASLGPDGLPALHRPVPRHVPALTDAALIKLYRRDQFSPILRDPGIEKQLAAALTIARAADPARFDRREPRLGHLLRDPAYLQSVLAAYLSHPARFTLYHHRLVPFLRGAAMLGAAAGETPSPMAGPVPGPPVAPIPVAPIPVGVSDVGTGTPAGPAGGPGTQAVPAPPSVVLLLLGAAGVAARRLGVRRGAKPAPFEEEVP